MESEIHGYFTPAGKEVNRHFLDSNPGSGRSGPGSLLR